MPPHRPPLDNAPLDADAIRRAERLLADRKRSLAATVADLCALFNDLARAKRERDESEAWWQAVLAQAMRPTASARRGFAHKKGDYDGPMAHRLGEENLETVRVACDKCGRNEAHKLADLVTRFGTEAGMPGVLRALAGECQRIGNYSDWCGLRFVDPLGARW